MISGLTKNKFNNALTTYYLVLKKKERTKKLREKCDIRPKGNTSPSVKEEAKDTPSEDPQPTRDKIITPTKFRRRD